MRVLLDNNVPPALAAELPGNEVLHCRDKGWAALLNGDLVRQADLEFDVLVTADRSMQFQTSLKGLQLRVAVLSSRSNRLADLQPLMPVLQALLPTLAPGAYQLVELPAE